MHWLIWFAYVLWLFSLLLGLYVVEAYSPWDWQFHVAGIYGVAHLGLTWVILRRTLRRR